MSSHYVGLMSGTSMDGIDAALVRLDEDKVTVLSGLSQPYEPPISNKLKSVTERPQDAHLDAVAQLDTALGKAFAAAALALLEREGLLPRDIVAIGSHGQSVRHRPDLGFTVQLADPNVITAETDIMTVADFRRRDVALGGQGAPLTPAFHRAVFAHAQEDRAVVNLGGIANVTLLPARGGVSGFDTGPGNVLLDAWIQQRKGEPYDKGGAWAAKGAVDEHLLEALMADDFFKMPPPKSTGREYFNLPWLAARLVALPGAPAPADVAATLCELTARTVTATLEAGVKGGHCNPHRVLVCGGGVHNETLMSRLAALLPGRKLASTEGFGILPDWVEAAAFAWLAYRTLKGQPGNAPSVTGASRETILGAIYPR